MNGENLRSKMVSSAKKKSSFVNYFYRLTGSSHMPLNRTAKEICTKFIRNAILHSSFAIFVTRIGVS